MSDTLSAILSRPLGPKPRPALYIGIAAAAPRHAPARFGLAMVDHVTIGRGDARTAKRYEVDGERLLAVQLADPRMSTVHVRLTRLGGQWILEDLGSKNGTWIAGKAVQQHTLGDGDVFEVGHTMVVFRTTGGDADDLDGFPPAAAPGLATLAPALAERLATMVRAAPSSLPVMIRGDTGTGKELLARAVHALSGRTGPFVAINCGALPASLVEAELFGHRAGAFTGAGAERTGVVRSADGGTLFLDEIGELPEPAQASLLRVLQEGEVTPIGADRQIKVDVRLVTATLRDLDQDVERGRFRDDLLGRLLGLTIALPPLRDRREDLGLITAVLLDRLAPGRGLELSPDCVRAIYAYGWPRNIRELERALAAACTLATSRIDLAHLPDPLRACAPPPRVATLPARLSPDEAQLRDDLAAALLRAAGNVTAVARELGKDRTQIRRWMRRFGLTRPEDD
jgi:transcriptional regulator of acetoin/glycerol metabolism